MRNLKVEVIGVKKRCGAKHKAGDSFFIRGGGTIEILNRGTQYPLT